MGWYGTFRLLWSNFARRGTSQGVSSLLHTHSAAAELLPPRPQLLDAVYEHGCTNWDTADIYGDNEDLIGQWYARNHYHLRK